MKNRHILVFKINFLLILTACINFIYAQDSSAVDSTLLKELMTEMSSATVQKSQASAQTGGTTVRTNPTLNPNISLIGDFRMDYNSTEKRHYNAYFNEAELAINSTVDPYARADFYLSAHRNEEGEFVIEPEEAYLTTLALPAQLQLKAGKFRSSFGRINRIHPHALRFSDNPAMYENYLGESLNDEGLSLSWLVPNPFDFYQELTLEVTDGPAESPSFIKSSADKFLYLAHLKNFWDLSDNSTLEFGISAVTGPNDSSLTTQIGGVDITYKWKPLRYNTYHSFEFQTEALLSNKKISPASTVKTWAMYSMATYQVSKRWFAGGRFDYANLPDSKDWIERAYSAFVSWEATEFQKLEMQFKHSTFNNGPEANMFIIRSIFVIGAHGAHLY
ncbi:MAG: hypothetical protein KDF60_17350 [Calditrichaeota bacterium]|nr:hypothetical protein [Calditrichota bacterium]